MTTFLVVGSRSTNRYCVHLMTFKYYFPNHSTSSFVPFQKLFFLRMKQNCEQSSAVKDDLALQNQSENIFLTKLKYLQRGINTVSLGPDRISIILSIIYYYVLLRDDNFEQPIRLVNGSRVLSFPKLLFSIQ